MDQKDHQPQQGPQAEDVAGTLLQGDAEALAAFGRLLGGRRDGRRRWALVGVEGVRGDRIRLQLRVGTLVCAIHLQPAASARAFVRAPGLAVCYEGRSGGVVLEALTRLVAARLQKHTFDELFRLLADHTVPTPAPVSAPEPRLPPAPLAPPQGTGTVAPHTADVAQAAPPAAPTVHVEAPDWCRFFVSRDCEDHDPNWVDPGVVVIEYSDRECFHSHEELDPRKWASYNDPRIPLPSRDAEIPPVNRATIQTELDEDAVIRGSLGIHDALVEEAGRFADRAELLIVNHLCTPLVIGDDLARLARRCEAAAGAPAFEITRTAKEEASLFHRALSRLLEEAENTPQTPDPDGVNLFGFPRRYREEELEPWLSQLGLRVVASPLPDVDCASLRRVRQAKTQIVVGPEESADGIVAVLGRFGLGGCVVPAPYGPEATRRCVAAIASETGRTTAWEKLWRAQFTTFSQRWSTLRERAERQRLGFVVDPASLGRLLEPPALGLDLLQLLQEMGFGIDLLCYTRGDGLPPRLRERVEARPVEGVRLRTFSSDSALQGLLRDPELRGVYSDYFFDRRLTACGKAQFSRRHLEPGLAGALRSLRALLAVCRVPFYERYAHHLKRTAGSSHG